MFRSKRIFITLSKIHQLNDPKRNNTKIRPFYENNRSKEQGIETYLVQVGTSTRAISKRAPTGRYRGQQWSLRFYFQERGAWRLDVTSVNVVKLPRLGRDWPHPVYVSLLSSPWKITFRGYLEESRNSRNRGPRGRPTVSALGRSISRFLVRDRRHVGTTVDWSHVFYPECVSRIYLYSWVPLGECKQNFFANMKWHGRFVRLRLSAWRLRLVIPVPRQAFSAFRERRAPLQLKSRGARYGDQRDI